MRVLHVSWEYPPLVYGGLGRHVHALARAQASRGDDVTVLTQATQPPVVDELVDGVRVIRVPHDPPNVAFREETLLAWVLSMQTAMIGEAPAVGSVDVIHAHDWVTAHAAITLRRILGSGQARQGRLRRPAGPAHPPALVATIHATEAGRHQGWLPGPLSDAIHSIEHWLVHSCDQVIACSQHMRREVERLFSPPDDRVDVIANGIDLHRWRTTKARTARVRDAHASTGPLIVFVGRLEWEKGAHTLVDALPRIRRQLPGSRAVIAGRGGHADALETQVRRKRLGAMVDFAGWLPEPELNALIAAADVLVVPSIYEPFGLVALEGAALGTPLVVARTGGLAEFVEDDVTGRTFEPGDEADLARAVCAAIDDPGASSRMARAARERLRASHGWALLAGQTDDVYRRALDHPIAAVPPALPRTPDRSVNLLRP